GCSQPAAAGAPRAAEPTELGEAGAGRAVLDGTEPGQRGGRDAGGAEALVEGPMQQRWMWFLWRWRWCVLTSHDLLVYSDYEASVVDPHRPLERYSRRSLDVARALHCHSTLVCMDASSRDPLVVLRTGPRATLATLVASRLWQYGFSAASRRCRSGDGVPGGPARGRGGLRL
ncbi:unnamed protein product, partial [Prorocentrum cordatum]